jgi:hypothetical protein
MEAVYIPTINGKLVAKDEQNHVNPSLRDAPEPHSDVQAPTVQLGVCCEFATSWKTQ